MTRHPFEGKKSKYSDSQIMAILKQTEAGTPIPELCREHGMSSATFYNVAHKIWRYGCLKELEEENRRCYRLLNVIGEFNREGLAIEVDLSLPAARVARVLNQIIEWRGPPKQIHCDNGPEYISDLLAAWAETKGIELAFIQPGQTHNRMPMLNAIIGQCVMIGLINIYSVVSKKFRSRRPVSFGHTIMNGLIRPSVE